MRPRRILDRASATGAELLSNELKNKVLGFVCTDIEKLPKALVQRTYGCDGSTDSDGRHCVFYGIIIRPDLADEKNVGEIVIAAADGSETMSAKENAMLEKVPTRKQIDALVEYFLLIQNWAKTAIQSKFGRLTRQR